MIPIVDGYGYSPADPLLLQRIAAVNQQQTLSAIQQTYTAPTATAPAPAPATLPPMVSPGVQSGLFSSLPPAPAPPAGTTAPTQTTTNTVATSSGTPVVSTGLTKPIALANGTPVLAFSVPGQSLAAVPVGSPWTVSVTGAQAYRSVFVQTTVNGAPIDGGLVGITGTDGSLQVSGTIPANGIGQWRETYYFDALGGPTIGSVAFTVVQSGPSGITQVSPFLDPNQTVSVPGIPFRTQTNATPSTVLYGTYPADTRGSGYGTLPAGSGNVTPIGQFTGIASSIYPIDNSTAVAIQARAPAVQTPSGWAYYYQLVTGQQAPAGSSLGFTDPNFYVSFDVWWNSMQRFVQNVGANTGANTGGLLGPAAGGPPWLKWAFYGLIAVIVIRSL